MANTSELPPDDPRYNLLSIQQDALVEIEPGVPDHTWDVMTGAAPATDIHSNSQGNRICPRKHYRVVFREVCTSMFEVENPFNAYRLLPGAIAGSSLFPSPRYLVFTYEIALQNIHSCGWTHRDISPGNILSHHGVPKISDFEFSEEFEVDRRTPPQRKGETIVRLFFPAILCVNSSVVGNSRVYRDRGSRATLPLQPAAPTHIPVQPSTRPGIRLVDSNMGIVPVAARRLRRMWFLPAGERPL